MAFVSSGGQRCESEAGRTLFDCADRLGVRAPTSCGRQGVCHECIVEVTGGSEALVTRAQPEAFLRGGYRLACQAAISDAGLDVEFAPLARRPQILTTSASAETEIDPSVTRQDGKIFYDGEAIDEDRGRLG